MSSGFVSLVTDKEWRGKKLYSFRLVNDDTWYNCGTKHPGVTKGDMIEFDVNKTENGRAQVNTDTIKVTKPAKTQVMTGKNGIGMTKDDYWSRKEERDIQTQKVIQLQSSRNSAIELTDVLIKNGAINLDKAAVAKRKQIILDQFNELVEYFQKESRGVNVPGNEAEMIDEDTTEPVETSEEEGDWANV